MSARGTSLIKRCRDNRVATHQMLVIILFWRRIAERRIRKAGSAGKRPVTTTQAVISEWCCIGRRAWCCWRCCWGERRLTRIKFVLFKSRRLLQRPSPKAKASRSWQPRRRRNIQL